MKDYNDQIASRIETVMITMRNASFRSRLSDEHSLRPAMFLLLSLLSEHLSEPNATPITASDLAKQMHVSPAAITQTLDALERKKMIERIKSETDRRVTFIAPTRKGRAVIKNTYGRFNSKKHRLTMMKELLEYLGEKDSVELARIMERVNEFMSGKCTMSETVERTK